MLTELTDILTDLFGEPDTGATASLEMDNQQV